VRRLVRAVPAAPRAQTRLDARVFVVVVFDATVPGIAACTRLSTPSRMHDWR
jgi:hypothetical protein